jgi:hypothetical protein
MRPRSCCRTLPVRPAAFPIAGRGPDAGITVAVAATTPTIATLRHRPRDLRSPRSPPFP